MADLHLISYVSTSLLAHDHVANELSAITDIAVERNASVGITGVLFYQNNHFFQVIEGQEADLRRLYSTLQHDGRHKDLAKLIDRPVPERQFADWAMDTFYVDNPDIINPKTLGLLQELYFHNFGADAPDLIQFTKRMIDEMDTFRIERGISQRLN